ncbi:hypothetical protein DUNSADRAFT_10907 [Dunaliella salina]|uniref:Trichohyalin-plectin-homology domain-containing protein n=1 Tax=Dunaliella salina TaxID=3046 RepID=A0ABQ7H4Q8_DUNSA|nr:hypothetical protein DUNSADRAFT_10907 [Dunaliella salina]|eukprot:KAF5841844.1 hypothetical protein DUNSADRAFT_10907 [Dunaliella salina]
MLTKAALQQSTKALSPSSTSESQLRSHSTLGSSRAFDGPNGCTPLFKSNKSAGLRSQTMLPGMQPSGHLQQQQWQRPCSSPPRDHTQLLNQPKQSAMPHLPGRPAKQRQPKRRGQPAAGASGEAWGMQASSRQRLPQAGPRETLSPSQIEAELNRMYAYGSKGASTGMDWTMPPTLLYTKAFALNINNDAGEMVKMQDTLANKAEALRQQERRKRQQERLQQCDEQMAEVMAKRREEAARKQDDGRYVDGIIAENKRREEEEKREKEEHQAAMSALYTTQLRERAALQQTEDLQLKREVALERMRNAELDRQDKEFRERRAAQNREKNEAMKRQMDEVHERQAQERAKEVEEERKATKEYAKAKKDEADMLRAQALFEAQEQEKERLKKMRQEDMNRERKATMAHQLAEREAAMQAQAQELRQLKEKIDAEQAADKEAAKAAKTALRERQAQEREAMRQAIMEENMRRYYLHNEPMSDREKGVHKKVLDLEERGFASLTLPKHNPKCLLKSQ